MNQLATVITDSKTCHYPINWTDFLDSQTVSGFFSLSVFSSAG